MDARVLAQTRAIAVYEYRCTAGPKDVPFTEVHAAHSISYVRQGSFGYRHRGRLHELVSGAVLIGRPGDEYMCTHEHHCRGDECISFKLSPEVADELDARPAVWRIGALAPAPQLMVLGELAQAVADGRSSIALEEIAYAFTMRLITAVRGEHSRVRDVKARERRRIIESARWIEANSHVEVDLSRVAAVAGMSPHHLLRTFKRVVGTTPHQYLIRSRLRHAARLLTDDGSSITQIASAVGFADLSNFVRTFGRVAGMSPQRFRQVARQRMPLRLPAA